MSFMTNLLNHDECWRMLCGVYEPGLIVLHGEIINAMQDAFRARSY
jgi:hypothetical protein